MKPSLTTRQYALPFVLITSLFFLWGFARAILDVLNKHFQNELQITLTESSLVQVITYLGYFLMAIPAGLYINRFGYRRGVVTGLLLYAAGAFLFVPSGEFDVLYGYLGALFVIACGLTFLETAANPYATELGPAATASSRLNLAQSFNGLGSALAPIIVGGFLFSGSASADVTMPYIVMGFVVVFVALIFYHSRLPEIRHGQVATAEDLRQEHTNGLANLRQLLRRPMFLFGLLALLAYEISEISINSYFINFTTGMGWLTSATASYVLGLSLFIFMGGRFLGSWLMRRIPAQRVLLWCACGSVSCVALLVLTSQFPALSSSRLPLVFLMANYLFESIMFPTIFSLSLQGLGNLTKSASSVLMMTPVGGCGFLLMALMADATGSFVLPFLIPLVGYLVVMLFARRTLLRQA